MPDCERLVAAARKRAPVTNYLDLCEDGDRPTLDPATCAPSSVPAGRTAFWMAASAKASRRDRSSVGIGCCSSNVQRIFGPHLLCTVAKPTPVIRERLRVVLERLRIVLGVASQWRGTLCDITKLHSPLRWLTFAVRLNELTRGILDAISIRRRQGCSHEPSQREPAGKGSCISRRVRDPGRRRQTLKRPDRLIITRTLTCPAG